MKERTFSGCRSLRSINLPSVEIVGLCAFCNCRALKDAKFSNKLQRFGQIAFGFCTSLERITIPLKDGMITNNDIFIACIKLNHVDLDKRAEIRETLAALYFEEWRKDMNEEIDSINKILPNAEAGVLGTLGDVEGEKAQVIRRWIRSVLDKIRYCKERQCILDEAVTVLQLALPRDVVMNNVLSFLALPLHRFGVEDHEDAGDDGVDGEQDDQHDLCCVIL